MLFYHFCSVRSHFCRSRNDFWRLRNDFWRLRKHFWRLRKHFWTLRNHFWYLLLRFMRRWICLNITHFFVFKERFDFSVQINTFRKSSPEIIENFLRNVEIIVYGSRHINDRQYLKFLLIIIFSDDWWGHNSISSISVPLVFLPLQSIIYNANLWIPAKPNY